MSRTKANTALVGVGVAACAVCCAGPILGVLAAIGLSTAAGFALFGSLAIFIGAAAVAFVVVRRQRRRHRVRSDRDTASGVGGVQRHAGMIMSIPIRRNIRR